MKLVLASNNRKKLAELRTLLSTAGVELLSAQEAGFCQDIEENGDTFSANARIKAETVCRATGLAAVGDDSGLCVDALFGAPGVLSARYTGCHEDSDEAKYRFLLKNLAGVKDRTARFVCAICCVLPDGTSITATGTCEGEILLAPQGDGGFGYDPVFRPTGYGCSMAELTAEEKNKISHRGHALVEFQRKWEEHHAHK